MIEKPPELKMEEKKPEEEFDEFLVPEEWIEDITEAQKDAYRMKVLANSAKSSAESKISSFFNPFKSHAREKTADKEPLAEDYKEAEMLYQQVYGPFPAEGQMDKAIDKTLEITSGNLMKAYVELRARMLARSEREEEKQKENK